MQMKESERIKIKRRGAELVVRQIAGMSRAQELEYWRALSKKMLESKQSLLKKAQAIAEDRAVVIDPHRHVAPALLGFQSLQRVTSEKHKSSTTLFLSLAGRSLLSLPPSGGGG